MVRRFAVTAFGIVRGVLGDTGNPEGEHKAVLSLGGHPRLATVTTPYDATRHTQTHKVFTHLYGFHGKEPITKGIGGFDSHQRGVCIGWRRTVVGAATLDTWHMKGCSQRISPDVVSETVSPAGLPSHSLRVRWCAADGSEFLSETRRLTLLPDTDGVRWVEVDSTLSCTAAPVRLLGDPHHAGLHVRLANEVCRHPWNTRYTIPSGARWGRDDCVHGAWWVLCRFVVRSKTRWLLFMTRPGHQSPPIYSARAYGKLGAFVEGTAAERPFRIQCKLGLSEHSLDGQACNRLFQAMNWDD
mgnify:CR=1 FL=1